MSSLSYFLRYGIDVFKRAGSSILSNFKLLETGDKKLLENGSRKLLESSP